MDLRRPSSAAAALVAESVAFSLALLVVARSLDAASASWWSIVAAVGAVYLVVGAVPVPRRAPLLVGAAAFLAPLVILGWIGWRTSYSRLAGHILATGDVPRLLLAPANLTTALFLSLCALGGYGLGRRLRGRASRRRGRAANGRL